MKIQAGADVTGWRMIDRVLGVFLVVALVTGAATAEVAKSSGSAAPPPEMMALLREGVRLDMVGDLAGADAIWEGVRVRYPRHPAGYVFQVDTLFWRHTFDEANRGFDAPIERNITQALRRSRAYLDRDESDAWAQLYHGQALMQRARLELSRDSIMAAGSSGEEGREHLEAALAIDPTLEDAKHHLGLYYYYAGVLPNVLKLFNWLWFVPKGDRELGLAYLHEAREKGPLTRWDAAFILLNVNTYLEENGKEEALEIARALHETFPKNSLLHFELIEVLAATQSYEAVIEESKALEASTGEQYHDAGRRRMARVWRAGAELQLGQPERSWKTLTVFGEEGPAEPSWARAWIQLSRGWALDVMGERDRAKGYYERVLALEPPLLNRRAAQLAEEALEAPYAIAAQASGGDTAAVE